MQEVKARLSGRLHSAWFPQGMRQIRCQSLGETWLSALREICRTGEIVGNQTRELLHVCVTFVQGDWDGDPLLARFASPHSAEEMRKVFFSNEPNAFGHSYADKLRGPQGRADLSDVIELLDQEPRSKRAVVTFVGDGDGRVPCINAVHFLLRGDGLTATYLARGQDMFRKFHADALCIYEMAQRVARGLNCRVREVCGFISSAHVYVRDLQEIERVLAVYESPGPKRS